MNTLVSFLIGLASIAFMITIHEAGHYLGARLSGITVEAFAIGWGRAIKRWNKNGIEYRINIFPLGGYCRLKGAEDLIKSHERHEHEIQNVSSGSIFAAHPLKRMITYLAGPMMNLIFAFLIFIPFFMLSSTSFSDPATILVTRDYPLLYGEGENAAEQGGLQTGDTVVSLNKTEIRNFQDISTFMKEEYGDGETLSVGVKRSSQVLTVPVLPILQDGRYLLGVASAITPVIASLDPLSPEAVAGAAVGDRILQVNGKESLYIADVLSAYLGGRGRMSMKLRHADSNEETIDFIPQRSAEGKIIAPFSFERSRVTIEGYSFVRAVASSAKETAAMIRETVNLFIQLVSGRMSAGESLAGPLRISYVIGETFLSGLRSFLQLMAMVSISLGIANLLPLPALDGGSIILSLIEWIRRKPLPVSAYLRYQSIGVIILSVLILFVLFSDARFFLS